MDKVVFLDRDGTINTEVNYLYRPEDLVLIPGVAAALAQLKRDGFKLIVVTNQAGVARGYYTEEDVNVLHSFLNEQLKPLGAEIDRYFYCPHHPEHGIGEYKKECSCRKPETGMFQMAEQYYDVDKEHSYMIGDKQQDTVAGRRYGVASILVGTGYGSEVHREQQSIGSLSEYDYFAETFADAVHWIEARERKL